MRTKQEILQDVDNEYELLKADEYRYRVLLQATIIAIAERDERNLHLKHYRARISARMEHIEALLGKAVDAPKYERSCVEVRPGEFLEKLEPKTIKGYNG